MKKTIFITGLLLSMSSFAGIINLEVGSSATVYTDTDTTVRCLGEVSKKPVGLVLCTPTNKAVKDKVTNHVIVDNLDSRLSALREIKKLQAEGICK